MIRPEAASPKGPATAATIQTAEPVLATMALPEEVKERFLTVKTFAGELVTVVELLSPNNKRTGHEGRRLYLAKREEILWSRVNLVEIDLLLNGERMLLTSPWPLGERFVLVARGTRLGTAEIYPIPQGGALPVIRFPLKPPDDDAALDLQRCLAIVWQRGNYPRLLRHVRAQA